MKCNQVILVVFIRQHRLLLLGCGNVERMIVVVR
jgi:hypothetical protein